MRWISVVSTLEIFPHRHQLSIKYFRETACGKAEKRCHEQLHYRQVSVYTCMSKIWIQVLTFSSHWFIAVCFILRSLNQTWPSTSEMLKCGCSRPKRFLATIPKIGCQSIWGRSTPGRALIAKHARMFLRAFTSQMATTNAAGVLPVQITFNTPK